MDSKFALENVDGLIQIYRRLANCTSSKEIETLRRSLKEKSIDAKNVPSRKRKMEEAEEGGREELEIPRKEKDVGRNRLAVVADLGKKVDNLIEEVKELCARGEFSGEVTIEVPQKMAVELPTSELVGDDSNRHAQEIWEFLTVNEESTIGVWGMGGVGKTSLVTHVYNYALKRSDLFGSVYWVTVSNECSLRELQLRIGKRVQKDLSDEDDERLRAGRLMQALAEKGKFTIFLDDVWTDFDLISAGIPKKSGCKLILTSRSQRVCHKMRCDKIIQVKPLGKIDSWNLFSKSIGHEIPNELIETATLVIEECSGLPLAIITLSKSMRMCYDICEWKSVLNKLRKSNPGVDDMEKKVFYALRLSFDRLSSSKLQDCLLHCATYPEDSEIERHELIWRFIDEGLLDMDANTREMFDEGHAILNELERTALLSSEISYLVSMHDLIRDMALQIAGFRFMVKAGVGLEDFPHEKFWTNKVELVSLVENKLRKTRDLKVKCGRLSTLLLQGNYFKSLSDSFFENLHGLKVLDLSFTKIRVLPKSILSLKELTSLDLRACDNLKTMSNLASLSSLRKLDLSYSGLREVPQKMEDLINLVYLNFFKTNIRKIDPSVLRRLTALEVLGIPNFDMNVREFSHLENLEHVEFHFVSIENFNAFVKHMQMNGRPSSYFLTLEKEHCATWQVNNYFSKKRVELRAGSTSGRNFPMLPGNVEDLQIFDQDIASLWDLLSSRLPLKSLSLHVMRNLKNPFGSGEKAGLSSFFSFSKLRTLYIFSCPKINKLFSIRFLSYLQNIEEISIKYCLGLEEVIEVANDVIVEGDERKIGPYTLPKLTSLTLTDLPELKSICSSDGVLDCVSLESIRISGCPKLRRMPFSLHNQHLPYRHVYLYTSNVEYVNSLDWDPPESKSMIDILESPSLINPFSLQNWLITYG